MAAPSPSVACPLLSVAQIPSGTPSVWYPSAALVVCSPLPGARQLLEAWEKWRQKSLPVLSK